MFFANDSNYDIPMDRKPHMIVDGGAHAGYASLYFANKYPEAQILAVDPEGSNVAILRENTASYPNIRVLQAGIWHRRTCLTISNQEAENWAFQVQESEGHEDAIAAITIEDIMQLASTEFIDILKLDIEGAEKEVFSGRPEWLAKVGILIIELHDRFKPAVAKRLMLPCLTLTLKNSIRVKIFFWSKICDHMMCTSGNKWGTRTTGRIPTGFG